VAAEPGRRVMVVLMGCPMWVVSKSKVGSGLLTAASRGRRARWRSIRSM
jgi:hypothetical protein